MIVNIDSYYGLVIGVVALSQFMLIGMSLRVGMARKKYNVHYPTMYDDKQPIFNCIQRVHQNTLESYSMFLVNILIGGLAHPILSSAAGLIWLISRIIYAKGYYTGEPKNRMTGVSLSYPALIVLLICSLSFAYKVFFN